MSEMRDVRPSELSLKSRNPTSVHEDIDANLPTSDDDLVAGEHRRMNYGLLSKSLCRRGGE